VKNYKLKNYRNFQIPHIVDLNNNSFASQASYYIEKAVRFRYNI